MAILTDHPLPAWGMGGEAGSAVDLGNVLIFCLDRKAYALHENPWKPMKTHENLWKPMKQCWYITEL